MPEEGVYNGRSPATSTIVQECCHISPPSGRECSVKGQIFLLDTSFWQAKSETEIREREYHTCNGTCDSGRPGDGHIAGEEEIEECLQCGLCCKIFGDRIYPTPENLYLWLESGRQDILRFFMACLEDGRWVWCTALSSNDLAGIHAVEMRDPATGGYLPVCPFLRRVAKSRYLCGIHTMKPEMCRNYQPWIWGETYFNRCKALKRREEASLWDRFSD